MRKCKKERNPDYRDSSDVASISPDVVQKSQGIH